jgi:hypothetical protein
MFARHAYGPNGILGRARPTHVDDEAIGGIRHPAGLWVENRGGLWWCWRGGGSFGFAQDDRSNGGAGAKAKASEATNAKAPAVAGALLWRNVGWSLGFFFFFCLRGGCRGSALGFVAWLADVDAAFEEGAVFDGDACGDDVAGKRTFAADVDAVRGLAVAANFAENDDLAGADVGCYLTVAANGDAVAGEVDGTFDFAINVERLGTGDLTLDDKALANGGLLVRGSSSCGTGGSGESGGGGRRRGTDGLGSCRRRARLIWFPHKTSVSFPSGEGYRR